jgi:ABC-type transport system substrate-binding protein
VAVEMAGNYWETKHAITGAPLERSPVFAADQPWIGNPFTPADGNNPQGMDDLEQARKVRWALAMAIDRQTIADRSFSGVAKPLYISMFHATDPKWQDKWKVNYDPAAAEKMLDEAGYPRKGGAQGVRFEMPVFGQTDNALFFEVSEIVAGYWRNIGVNTTILHTAYSVLRPSMVQRSNVTPIVMTCRENNGGAPWDWPRMSEYSSITRGGFGCQMEIPKIAEIYLQVSKEVDEQKRIAMNNELADYVWDQMFGPGVVSVPDAVAYNPKSIKAWNMRPGIFTVVNSPELIELAPR